ncbi:MAG TPA: hypothetical protein VIW80_14315, partial [Pyrinomonadaceae bacterium]
RFRSRQLSILTVTARSVNIFKCAVGSVARSSLPRGAACTLGRRRREEGPAVPGPLGGTELRLD